MIIKQYSRYTVPNWVKWVFIGLCLVVVSCFIYILFLYQDIQESKTKGFEKTKQLVLEETDLTTINHISRFNGESEYRIVVGATNNKEEKMVFVPVDQKSAQIVVIDTDKIIQKQSIKNQWQGQCTGCELVEIAPAMINEKPLWEITYIDQSERYIFDYLSIYDGTRFQQLRLKNMFK